MDGWAREMSQGRKKKEVWFDVWAKAFGYDMASTSGTMLPNTLSASSSASSSLTGASSVSVVSQSPPSLTGSSTALIETVTATPYRKRRRMVAHSLSDLHGEMAKIEMRQEARYDALLAGVMNLKHQLMEINNNNNNKKSY
jgi:hypothetical protein